MCETDVQNMGLLSMCTDCFDIFDLWIPLNEGDMPHCVRLLFLPPKRYCILTSFCGDQLDAP